MTKRKVALVTGANRGIGYEICRQLGQTGLSVILGARHREKGERAARTLRAEGLEIHFQELDMADEASIESAVRDIEEKFSRLDALINNAAIAPRGDKTLLDFDYAVLDATLKTNLYGPILLCRACVPLLEKSGQGRIVNVSSGKGSFFKLAPGTPFYRISKTALNSYTKVLAAELEGRGILVNAMTPGWVRTRLGGLKAPRSVDEGARTAVWLATVGDDGPHGKFFRDGEEFPW